MKQLLEVVWSSYWRWYERWYGAAIGAVIEAVIGGGMEQLKKSGIRITHNRRGFSISRSSVFLILFYF